MVCSELGSSAPKPSFRLRGVLAPGLKILLTTGLVCHSCGAFAQLPGAGAPAGMSATLTKLFGNITAFKARADLRVLDPSQKEITSTPMDFALQGQNVRMEMDLAEVKSKDVPPGFLDTLKKMGMSHVISIIRTDKKQVFAIYPDQKILMTLPISKEESEAAAKTPKIEATPLGKEAIDGHECVKKKVNITDDQGKTLEAITWTAADLKDFPLQISTTSGDNSTFIRFSQVKLGTPEGVSFEPPTGYTEYSSQEALLQSVMKKILETTPKN